MPIPSVSRSDGESSFILTSTELSLSIWVKLSRRKGLSGKTSNKPTSLNCSERLSARSLSRDSFAWQLWCYHGVQGETTLLSQGGTTLTGPRRMRQGQARRQCCAGIQLCLLHRSCLPAPHIPVPHRPTPLSCSGAISLKVQFCRCLTSLCWEQGGRGGRGLCLCN